MARTEHLELDAQGRRVEVYSGGARFFHWLTVLLIAVQFPIGFYMVYRGKEMVWTTAEGVQKTGLWDATTDLLYSSHKLLGVLLLGFVVLRLLYRFGAGAPADEPTLTMFQRVVSALNHWALYLLLLAVPALGYIGISAFGALDVFGIVLPSVVDKDQSFARDVFDFHKVAAIGLLALIGLHVAAALYHAWVRQDTVMARMMPSLLRRSRRG